MSSTIVLISSNKHSFVCYYDQFGNPPHCFVWTKQQQEVKKEIINLSSKKATRIGDITAKVLKTNTDTYSKGLTALVNDCLGKEVFPDQLKLADVSSPIFKKGKSLDKENYRPANTLCHISRVFERILCKQINNFIVSYYHVTYTFQSEFVLYSCVNVK